MAKSIMVNLDAAKAKFDQLAQLRFNLAGENRKVHLQPGCSNCMRQLKFSSYFVELKYIRDKYHVKILSSPAPRHAHMQR